ncbi:MAG: LysM peptidoglycan-binding domain-containing protein [Chloroflexi bacterium]|nr:LysM peptidoglycan-binding domain-containing protein [Chloroflexota bacterium]
MAALFLLLLLFSLTWPGHGVWLLIIGVPLVLAGVALWWRDRIDAQTQTTRHSHESPFANVSAYGLTGASLRATRRADHGVPASMLLAPIGALAILLFIGGALGADDPAVDKTETVLRNGVTAIDRSGDGESRSAVTSPRQLQPVQTAQQGSIDSSVSATEVSPPANTQRLALGQSSQSTQSLQSTQSSAVVKPIVVAAPTPASAASQDAGSDEVALPQSANTFEYVVEDGDTLYDIAERYDTTVNKLMELNSLDSFSFIHPGDVLLVPQDGDGGDES